MLTKQRICKYYPPLPRAVIQQLKLCNVSKNLSVLRKSLDLTTISMVDASRLHSLTRLTAPYGNCIRFCTTNNSQNRMAGSKESQLNFSRRCLCVFMKPSGLLRTKISNLISQSLSLIHIYIQVRGKQNLKCFTNIALKVHYSTIIVCHLFNIICW